MQRKPTDRAAYPPGALEKETVMLGGRAMTKAESRMTGFATARAQHCIDCGREPELHLEDDGLWKRAGLDPCLFASQAVTLAHARAARTHPVPASGFELALRCGVG